MKLMASLVAEGTKHIPTTESSKDQVNKLVGGTIREGLDKPISIAEQTPVFTLAPADPSPQATTPTGGPAMDSKIKAPEFKPKMDQNNIANTHDQRKVHAELHSADSSTDQVIIVDKEDCARRCFKRGGKDIHCVVTRGCKHRGSIEQARKRRRNAETLKKLRMIHWQWL